MRLASRMLPFTTGAPRAGRATARGMALQRAFCVLYPGQIIAPNDRSTRVSKRQPAGTGSRSTGAFGLRRIGPFAHTATITTPLASPPARYPPPPAAPRASGAANRPQRPRRLGRAKAPLRPPRLRQLHQHRRNLGVIRPPIHSAAEAGRFSASKSLASCRSARNSPGVSDVRFTRPPAARRAAHKNRSAQAITLVYSCTDRNSPAS
jgi:hypothetical protein